MIRTVKILSIILTFSLFLLVFWGIYKGMAFSQSLWLIYIALVVADWQCIKWLKKQP